MNEHEQTRYSRVGYASPQDALAAPPEEFISVATLHIGTGVDEPDFLALVDVNPQSDTYRQIVHRTPSLTWSKWCWALMDAASRRAM